MRNILMIDSSGGYSSIYPIDSLHGDEQELVINKTYEEDMYDSSPYVHDYSAMINAFRIRGRG